MLRVFGLAKKVKRFLAESYFEPSKVWFRGDPHFIKSRGSMKISGFSLPISGSHGASIMQQALDASRCIEQNHEEFSRLAFFRFLRTSLDFGLYDLATEEQPWPSYRIPKRLVMLAGKFGFEIELSFYGPP
jgi:hypothetical protein